MGRKNGRTVGPKINTETVKLVGGAQGGGGQSSPSFETVQRTQRWKLEGVGNTKKKRGPPTGGGRRLSPDHHVKRGPSRGTPELPWESKTSPGQNEFVSPNTSQNKTLQKLEPHRKLRVGQNKKKRLLMMSGGEGTFNAVAKKGTCCTAEGATRLNSRSEEQKQGKPRPTGAKSLGPRKNGPNEPHRRQSAERAEIGMPAKKSKKAQETVHRAWATSHPRKKTF